MLRQRSLSHHSLYWLRTGGLGVNTGLQGMHNAMWKLALCVRGLAGWSLLKTYEDERREPAITTIRQSLENRVWYVGLASVEAHIERVRQRVRLGGHDIPEADIRRRYRHSRVNLVQLLPVLTELRMYDNSVTADPAAGHAPQPMLVLHVTSGRIVGPPDLSSTPEWAKPVIAAALDLER
jgi:hypothetical protein